MRGFTLPCCWNAKSTDVTVGVAKYEDKSLYFILNFILLSIFYLLPFYRWIQVILISSHCLMNMVSLTLHYWIYILINRSTINTHILFGHKPPLDTYLFFGNELPLDIYYLDIDHCQIYLIMLNRNHEPQLDMDFWTPLIIGHLIPN